MYASVGEVARLAIEATWNQALLGITPSEKLDIRFLQYSLTSRRSELLAEVRSNTQSNLNATQVANLTIPLPPLPEQRDIADYLDRETAQIDTLIEEQERFVSLTQERKRSVVLSAAFLGLDEAPRSANTEPWLPDTPVHWPIIQLGQACETQSGWAFPSVGFSENRGQSALLRGVNVKPGTLDWSETVYWDASTIPIPSEYELLEGDVVFGMDRPFIGSGVRAAKVTPADLPCLLVQRVLRLRARHHCVPEYIEALITAGPLRDYLQPIFTGVSVPHVSEWQIRKFRMPLPPKAEQTEIANYITTETSQIDSLLQNAERLIELSRERRAALITAAVTGQIDARAMA